MIGGSVFIGLRSASRKLKLREKSPSGLSGLTRNAELNVGASGTHGSTGQVIEWFEECWADSEPYDLAALYEPLWGEHSPWTVFLRMLLERYGAHLDEEEASATRFELTRADFPLPSLAALGKPAYGNAVVEIDQHLAEVKNNNAWLAHRLLRV